MSGGAGQDGAGSDGAGEDLPSLAVHRLRAVDGRLAVAESLTGGLLAGAVTAVPGASVVFRGGVVAYATEVKRSVLGVDGELLAARGAVHPVVARQMADGVRRLLGADWGVATTGVAGPAEQDGQPVGTVYVAAVGPGREQVRDLRIDGDRGRIRAASVRAALRLLLGCVPEA